MLAILVDHPGGPETLRIGEAAEPSPGPGEALVAVKTVGVNRADLLQRMGKYPPPPGASPVLGLELAGEVITDPTGRFDSGARVMGVVTGGAYAERATVPASTLMPVPEGMDWVEAAAIPEAFLTAWLNLVDLGRLRTGDDVLIHAGASGVGSAAIQLARRHGGRIACTAGSEAKLELCRSLGATLAIDRHQADPSEVIRDAWGGVNLVLDFVGAPAWKGNLACLRRGGRLVLIGFLGGSRGDLDLGPVLRKNLTVSGTTLRATDPETKATLVRAFVAGALPDFASGELKAVVDRAMPLREAAEAHRVMEANRNAGKIVLVADRRLEG